MPHCSRSGRAGQEGCSEAVGVGKLRWQRPEHIVRENPRTERPGGDRSSGPYHTGTGRSRMPFQAICRSAGPAGLSSTAYPAASWAGRTTAWAGELGRWGTVGQSGADSTGAEHPRGIGVDGREGDNGQGEREDEGEGEDKLLPAWSPAACRYAGQDMGRFHRGRETSAALGVRIC
jgi:hypothetical protein